MLRFMIARDLARASASMASLGALLSSKETRASAGMGVARTGWHHAWPYLKSGQLSRVLLDQHDPGSYELVMVYPHRALVAPRVRATIDHLLAEFARDEALHVPLGSLAAYAAVKGRR